MYKKYAFIFIFIFVTFTLALVESRKVQFDLKEVAPQNKANKTALNTLDIIDSLLNAYKNARMHLSIKTYSQFNQNKKKQSDIKVDSFKFKIKRNEVPAQNDTL